MVSLTGGNKGVIEFVPTRAYRCSRLYVFGLIHAITCLKSSAPT